MTTPNSFEERLLEQLRHVVAARPAPAVAARPVPQRRPRRARLALAGAGVAAASVAIALVATSSDVTPSAYAVESQPGGAVTVAIHSLSDADGLQRSLRAAGIPADVRYVASSGAAGCVGPTIAPPSGPEGGTVEGFAVKTRTAGAGDDGGPSLTQSGSSSKAEPSLSGPGPVDSSEPRTSMSKITVGPDGATFTIDPGTLHSGEKVFITTSSGELSSISMAIGKQRPAGVCPPAPPAP